MNKQSTHSRPHTYYVRFLTCEEDLCTYYLRHPLFVYMYILIQTLFQRSDCFPFLPVRKVTSLNLHQTKTKLFFFLNFFCQFKKKTRMCIAVFMWKAHPLYPLFLLLNRDEYHNRDTKPMGWWEGGEILGGRDGVAGGTWLACSRNGRVAFVTNVRELHSLPQAKSRGDLPVQFLLSRQSPKEYAEEVAAEADLYNGFNLIVGDLLTKTMFYVTNRPTEGLPSIIEVPPGIHVLTNASLDTPWLKAKRLDHGLREKLKIYSNSELPVTELVDSLMTDTARDDLGMLPKIYPPEREHQLSAIFVECDTPLGLYGTRSTSAVTVKASGELNFYERYLENDAWREHSVDFTLTNWQ